MADNTKQENFDRWMAKYQKEGAALDCCTIDPVTGERKMFPDMMPSTKLTSTEIVYARQLIAENPKLKGLFGDLDD
jgi:hypothetical protein